MAVLEEIRKSGFNIGSRIELVLFAGAERDNGIRPDGNMGRKGWEGGLELTTCSGARFTGYIAGFEKDRIFLSQGWYGKLPAGDITYYHKEVIYAFHHCLQGVCES